MRLLFDIGHPAHVHMFKNLIWELRNRDHEIKITARDKDIVLDLLDSYGFDYRVISTKGKGLLGLGIETLIRDYRLFKIARKFKPDVMTAVLGPLITHVGTLLRIPSIIFTDSNKDTEIADLLTIPFSSTVLTLTSVRKNFGKKEVRVSSYKELAYLHPNWFKPDPAVLSHAGISKNEKYALLRFVSWTAYHDVGRKGLDLKSKQKIIEVLIDHGITPYISSESKLPPEFIEYSLPIPPEKLHDFLYYAKLFVGDSQTMTTEAACLGVPAIKCNSFVGDDDDGNFIELENEYNMIFNFSDPNKALNKLSQLLSATNFKKEWITKRNKLLRDKIDLTAFMIWFIENYPESIQEMKENPRLAMNYKFKKDIK